MTRGRWRLEWPGLIRLVVSACLLLGVARLIVLATGAGGAAGIPSRAEAQVPPAAPVPEAGRAPAAAPPTEERALIDELRSRRSALEERDAALAAREMLLRAAETRLAQRIEEMAALQRGIESAGRALDEREEAGWRSLVKTYEAMRPRDAATVFDDLENEVLVQIVSRMREAKAAPVLGAMRPDRARLLTAELARFRASARSKGE